MSKILNLKNGKMICAYCGNEIIEEVREEWCNEYDNCGMERYTVRHCTCNDWNRDITLDKDVSQLDLKYYNKLDKIVREYRIERRNIIEKCNKNEQCKMYPSTSEYISKVRHPRNDDENKNYVVK